MIKQIVCGLTLLSGLIASGHSITDSGQSGSDAVHEQYEPTQVNGIPADKPFHRFALKTNLLYDAALMPNLELEWRMSRKMSLALEGNVAWWKNDPKHKYYNIAMVSPELRLHMLQRAPWHGMYVGVFVGGGIYDLENGKTGYRGEGGMAGLSIGYMWPISRNLSLEAGVGAGYLYSRYKEYIPYDGHYLYQRTKDLNYVGPLKLKFALVWRFKNINKPTKANQPL